MNNATSPGSAAYAAQLMGGLMENLGQWTAYGAGALILVASASLSLNIASYETALRQPPQGAVRNNARNYAWQRMAQSDFVALIGGILLVSGPILRHSGQWLASRETQCLIGNALN